MSAAANERARAAALARRRAAGKADALSALRHRAAELASRLERVAARVEHGEPAGFTPERRAAIAGSMRLLAALHLHHVSPPADCEDSVADTFVFDWRRAQAVRGCAGSPAAMCVEVA